MIKIINLYPINNFKLSLLKSSYIPLTQQKNYAHIFNIIEEENESFLSISHRKSRIATSAKVKDEACLEDAFPEDSEQFPESHDFEYSKQSLRNFHRKSAMEKPKNLESQSQIFKENKSEPFYKEEELDADIERDVSISEIKGIVDNITLNSGEMPSFARENFFSSSKKDFSQFLKKVFPSDESKIPFYLENYIRSRLCLYPYNSN